MQVAKDMQQIRKVENVLKYYHEPLFNLQFFNSYLKKEPEVSYPEI